MALFVAQSDSPLGNACCALFALDLETRRMCWLINPALASCVSPDGRRLFTPRGDVGIEVFDAKLLGRLPSKPREFISLIPPPDARWLLEPTIGEERRSTSLISSEVRWCE